MDRERCSELPSPALLRGIEEFNQGLFFEQHETLEDAWIEESDSIRYLYQGILQIGVGFLHLNRGNFSGATSLLRRGLSLLRPFLPVCMGVDLERFILDTERAQRALLDCGAGAMAEFDRELFPKIRFAVPEKGGAGSGV